MSASTPAPPLRPFAEADEHLMRRALELAERGLYATDPNPRVGCVLVREDRVIGEGWHRAAGGPHAEVEALRSCREDPRGATAYVTLEPCAHFGRTPPCAEALASAGVARVVAAMHDPNGEVDGRGARLLRAAGVLVEVGLLEAEATALNPGFVHRMRIGRPWVRLKLAASIDGRTALASGESRWITGAEARADVQHWRARSSAILTGAGTVRTDDPRLSVREDELPASRRRRHYEPVRPPLRAIVAASGRLRPHSGAATLAMQASPGEIVVLGARPCGHAFEHVPVPLHGGKVDLEAVLGALAARGCNEVLAECGPTLAGALFEQRLVDECILYLAPCVLGTDARPLLDVPGPREMRDRRELDLIDVERLGADVRLTMKPRS